MSKEERRKMVDADNKEISISRQCELLGISRSCYYYKPKGESEANILYMKLIKEQFAITPFYGARKMTAHLRSLGYHVNYKRIRRLMKLLGLRAIYPQPDTSKPNKEHKIYPYLLRDMKISRPDQVWSLDITYIPMRKGFMYLIAIIDVYSRYIVDWELSNNLEKEFCIDTIKRSLKTSKPEITNTDQGSQFTSNDFVKTILDADVKVSMDGKGRALDNVYIERFWRSFKYEDLYLKSYEDGKELYGGIKAYVDWYNNTRPHAGIEYQIPAEKYMNEQRFVN